MGFVKFFVISIVICAGFIHCTRAVAHHFRPIKNDRMIENPYVAMSEYYLNECEGNRKRYPHHHFSLEKTCEMYAVVVQLCLVGSYQSGTCFYLPLSFIYQRILYICCCHLCLYLSSSCKVT